MTREVTIKFTQEIPPQYVNGRKPIEEASKLLIKEIRESFNFNGNIEVIEEKEIV